MNESSTSLNAVTAPEAVPLQEESFEAFGLDARILQALTAQGYTKPTPIQAQAIPVAMQGRDIMGAAQTGTGKTASFALPIIQRLLPHANTSTSPARHVLRALILAPTRELADQVADNFKHYCQFTPLRSAVVFGGIDIHPQTAELRRGIEILVATPGRLLDHLQQKSVSLSQVEILVLDEADRMLDMGFLPDLQRIMQQLPKERQTLLFSATFSNDIQKLAKSFLQKPVTIQTAQRNTTSANIEQIVFQVSSIDAKRRASVALIRRYALTQVIIFSNTKLGASRLARHLEQDGVTAVAIHGDKSQVERMKALEAFKAGEVIALVATDVAARGLDIAELPCVINFDLPHSPEDYVHRIGRTGRAGALGKAYALCAPGDERALADIEKLTHQQISKQVLTLDAEPGSERSARPREASSSARPRSAEVAGRDRRPGGGEQERGRRRQQESKDQGPLRYDEEFERLRHRLHRQVDDALFAKPYEAQEDSSMVDNQAAPTSVASSANNPLLGKINRKKAEPAALLIRPKPKA